MTSAAHLDLYQLTSLVPHFKAGLSDVPVTMTFFSRRLPRNVATKAPARGYLLWAGLQRCLDYLERAQFDDASLQALKVHPILGQGLTAAPGLVDLLRDWRFSGTILAPAEGTPLLAGPATRLDGTPIDVNGVRPAAYCPYLRVETDLLSAKLIETPLLSYINHMTMVCTKASLVVQAANGMGPDHSVLEFGTRRTHPFAAVDAATAAFIAGVAATSNVEAHLRHGVPMAGTMDHFAIQAWEREGVPRHETEFAYFSAFHKDYPMGDVLLIDTYDTFGARTGIRNAVAATEGGPAGIRIDSAISRETIVQARALLDSLGATHTRIYISGGLDEHAIRDLGDAPVDGYGVGERIVTSPDAPVGVGAVGKLSMIGGRPTMKLSRGSGKATLPGPIQCWRTDNGDVVGLDGDDPGGTPLLEPVWTHDDGRLPGPSLIETRDHARASLDQWSDETKAPHQRGVTVTDNLADLVSRLIREGTSE